VPTKSGDSRMKACVLLFVLLVTVTCAQSRSIFSSDAPSGRLQSLSEARIFALGGVGFAGKIPQELILFRAIMALKPDQAKEDLENLYSGGNPQAMSYALVGMRKLDQKRYAELLVSARASDATVTTMWGCAVENEKLRTIANDLDVGKYDPWLQTSGGGMVYENHNQIDSKAVALRAVTGKAHDEQGVMIPNVSLGLFTEKDHRLVMITWSATDGAFQFASVTPGRYRLVAKYDGLCPANVPIRVTRLSSADRGVDLHMMPRGIDTCSYGAGAPATALKNSHADH
jgi:hypothetical protein